MKSMSSSRKPQINILNGPNLNLLGQREPEIYGTTTLADIKTSCEQKAIELGLSLCFTQTNSEGTMVDEVQAAMKETDGLIINAGAYTHTSIAIHDALKALSIPKIELHLSNVHAREGFRRRSRLAPAVDGLISGFGAHGYELALEAIHRLISS